jgi:hypothetical protein
MNYIGSLMFINYISVLDLKMNQLGDVGARIVSGLIELSKSLVHLDVRSNGIGNKGTEINRWDKDIAGHDKE